MSRWRELLVARRVSKNVATAAEALVGQLDAMAENNGWNYSQAVTTVIRGLVVTRQSAASGEEGNRTLSACAESYGRQ
jgi:hypothetical protein